MLRYVRHNVQPQAVAARLTVKVGAVGAVGNSLFFKVVFNILPMQVEEGTNDIAPQVLHAGKALQSAAPYQVQHYALRLVLHVMGNGDALRAVFLQRTLKELIPLLPCRLLKGLALSPCYCGNIQPFLIQGHAKLCAQLPHIGLISLRFLAPYAVV